MSTDVPLPPHLQRIGRQLTAAAHRRAAGRRRRSRPSRVLLAVPAAAAVAIAVVLVIGAGTSTPPAYALTKNHDGSITITLHNLTTGIAQLNSRLERLGINETVIPVKNGCPTLGLVAGTGRLSERVTIGPGKAAPGFDGVLAAEQLPGGRIAIGIGERQPPLPRCFSPRAITAQPVR